MVVCDYCGKDCSPDHADFKLEAYRWNYSGYQYGAHNTLHFHGWCYKEIIQVIRLARRNSLAAIMEVVPGVHPGDNTLTPKDE